MVKTKPNFVVLVTFEKDEKIQTSTQTLWEVASLADFILKGVAVV